MYVCTSPKISSLYSLPFSFILLDFFWKPEYPLARILTNVLIKRCYTKRKHATFLNLEFSLALYFEIGIWKFPLFFSPYNKLLFSFWAEKRCNFVDNNSSRIPTIVLSKKRTQNTSCSMIFNRIF